MNGIQALGEFSKLLLIFCLLAVIVIAALYGLTWLAMLGVASIFTKATELGLVENNLYQVAVVVIPPCVQAIMLWRVLLMERDVRGEMARSMDDFREVSKATTEGLQAIENITTVVQQEISNKLKLTLEALDQRDAAWLESIRREFDRDLYTRMCEGRKKPTEP